MIDKLIERQAIPLSRRTPKYKPAAWIHVLSSGEDFTYGGEAAVDIGLADQLFDGKANDMFEAQSEEHVKEFQLRRENGVVQVGAKTLEALKSKYDESPEKFKDSSLVKCVRRDVYFGGRSFKDHLFGRTENIEPIV